MDGLEQQYREHILPISVADFKAITGRSLQDVTLELLISRSTKYEVAHSESVNSALRNMYEEMERRGIQDAVCLQLDVKTDKIFNPYYFTTAYAVGLRPKETDKK